MSNLSRISLSMLLTLLTAFAHSADLPTLKYLATSEKHLTSIPSFESYGNTLSNQDGNLYFHVDTGNHPDPVIMRLTPDQHSTLMKAPSGGENDFQLAAFSVTPAGTLWILCNDGNHRDTRSAFAFDSDGRVRSTVKLDLPATVDITDFGVFDRGTMFVAGYFNRSATKAQQGKGYAALFGPTGVLTRTLDAKTGNVDLAKVALQLHQGDATVGNDGRLYFLSGSTLLSISEAGAVTNSFRIENPQQFTATKVMYSEGWLCIVLSQPQSTGPLLSQYLVLDASTGQLIGRYEPTPELGNDAVAFSRRDGITFRSENGGRVEFLVAALK